MSVINKKLSNQLTKNPVFNNSEQQIIDIVSDFVNAFNTRIRDAKLVEHQENFGHFPIDVIFRGDLVDFCKKAKSASDYLYEYSPRNMHSSNRLSNILKRELYAILNQVDLLSPEYVITSFRYVQHEFDEDHRREQSVKHKLFQFSHKEVKNINDFLKLSFVAEKRKKLIE